MKYPVAILAVFFLVPTLLLAQENIVILPPVAASRIAAARTPTPPPPEMRSILIDFRNHYRGEIKKLFASDQPADLWWILVLLTPECEGYKGWCIQIVAAKEKKGAKTIIISRIPILDKATFDSVTEAKKAAEKTKEKITGSAMKAKFMAPLNKAPFLFCGKIKI